MAEHGHRSVALIGPPPAVYDGGTSYASRFMSGFGEAVDQLVWTRSRSRASRVARGRQRASPCWAWSATWSEVERWWFRMNAAGEDVAYEY